MTKAGKITSIRPPYAIPGGEISIECEGFEIRQGESFGVIIGGREARIIGASAARILAVVPDDLDSTDVGVEIHAGGERSEPVGFVVARKLTDEMHIVANPAVDPKDDSIILTRSGSRGQQMPVTLLRLDRAGFVDELSANVMNPTGIAFDKEGNFLVTNRSDGEICRIERDEEIVTVANGLGVATGIAIDSDGRVFVGDRSGTIFQISEYGTSDVFASLEPSVSAYHMAFGPDGRLYVTAPGLASFDSVYAVDKAGFETCFFRGLGRPQGIAFDRNGNLYVAACLAGKRGIVRIAPDAEKAEMYVAGNNVIGLCFTRAGEMIVATGESVFALPIGVYGTLLD